MSTSASDLKTEGLAKKLAQSTNQKCNFKYLMNSKTIAPFKSALSSKENQIQSVIVGSAHKFATKTSKFTKLDSQLANREDNILSQQNENLPIRQVSKKLFIGQTQTKTNQSQLGRNRINTIDLPVSNAFLDLQQKVKTDFSQNFTQQFGCMTEDCYYEKELLIKMELLKKERDDIWNSISDIVKQNLTLKQIVAQLTIDAKTSARVGVQTQSALVTDNGCQTELYSSQIDQLFQVNRKKTIQLEEAKQFCIKMTQKAESDEYSSQVNLKDLLVESINLSLMNISRQFQRQKQLLTNFSCNQIDIWKKEVNNLKNELSISNAKLQQATRLTENVKKIYQKQLGELRCLVQQKQISFINEILNIKQEWQDTLVTHEMKSKFYLQYFENAKDCFREKQTLYSTLLSESHRTIHNLMGQMKEFSDMANTNYHKHLKKERSQQHIDHFQGSQ